MDTNILLESGTNELEILEFTLGDNTESTWQRSGRFCHTRRLLLYRIHIRA